MFDEDLIYDQAWSEGATFVAEAVLARLNAGLTHDAIALCEEVINKYDT
jgi:hypothetical protein